MGRRHRPGLRGGAPLRPAPGQARDLGADAHRGHRPDGASPGRTRDPGGRDLGTLPPPGHGRARLPGRRAVDPVPGGTPGAHRGRAAVHRRGHGRGDLDLDLDLRPVLRSVLRLAPARGSGGPGRRPRGGGKAHPQAPPHGRPEWWASADGLAGGVRPPHGGRVRKPRSSSGAVHEVVIHGVGAAGAGVGRLNDGRVVFVHRTAPGDRVRVRLTQEKGRWARGRVDRVLEGAPERRVAPCVYYDRCGGCTLQHLEPEAQLAARGVQLQDALERIGKLEDLPPVELHAAPAEFHYRNRASFTLRRLGVRPPAGPPPRSSAPDPSEPQVVAGFHALDRPGVIVDIGAPLAPGAPGASRSGEPQAAQPCLLVEPALASLWAEIRRHWGRNASRLPAGMELRLTLRALSDGTGVLLVEGGAGRGEPEALLKAVPGLRAIWSRPGGAGPQGAPGAGRTDGEGEGVDPPRPPRLLAGEEDPVEHWFGEALPVRPGAFLQVNREGAHRLHDLALAELGARPGERILDAYCGFGVYGRAAARAGALAVGIELDPQAVAMGRDRPVPGFDLLEGAVEDRLPGELPADRVVLNPPRGGVEAGVMEALAAHPPRRLVYVSCDPATLARDLRRLGDGFRLVRLQAVDLFPQTAHIETVATLDRIDPSP
ncbi:MAG: class I SAM-dependent RNA methyltransferase [Gemmatimonadales bacterium]|nr:MAG: class I SAM-dependent RNA methyltransferase [Gemmatimonadales bacterium]